MAVVDIVKGVCQLDGMVRFEANGRRRSAWVALLCLTMLVAGAAPGLAAQEAVIAPGNEELLAAMLGKGGTLPEGCKLTGGEVQHSKIRATYQCAAGEVVLELLHPQQAPASATRTERFAIVVVSGTPPPTLLSGIEALVRAKESGFEWTLLADSTGGRSPYYNLAISIVVLLVIIGIGWLIRRRRAAP